jgi:hypothetical protein
MFVVLHRDRIIGRSTTLYGADAIRQQKRRGVLYQLLCVDNADLDRETPEREESRQNAALSATSRKAG